jgi:hypothetical protein
VSDPASPQQPSTTRVALAFVGDQVLWAFAGASASTRKTGHPDGIEYCLELRALVALARRHDDRERPPLPVAGEVHLARQSSPATSDRLVRRMEDPLSTSRWLGLRRAPAACWWARATVLSTLTPHRVVRPQRLAAGARRARIVNDLAVSGVGLQNHDAAVLLPAHRAHFRGVGLQPLYPAPDAAH